jgi:hypothetical protein
MHRIKNPANQNHTFKDVENIEQIKIIVFLVKKMLKKKQFQI